MNHRYLVSASSGVRTGVDYQPLSHASNKFAVLAPAPRPAPLLFLSITLFSDPKKNDLDNDPLQGRSLLKQANPREKPNAI